MEDFFELETLDSNRDLMSSSDCSEREELLSAYRLGHTRSRAWLALPGRIIKHQYHKCAPIYIPFTYRKLMNFVYPLTLVFAGILVSYAVTTYQQYMTIDPFDAFFAQFWDDALPSTQSHVHYPIEFFGSVLPIPCHSHNDYWRRTPLFAALGSGCTSVEADIWLRHKDLHVGHTENSLHENRTLQSMYIRPLVSILEQMNKGVSQQKIGEPVGVFYNDPMQSLTLLVDFKTAGAEVWSLFYQQLQPLREGGWLTHWNGTDRVERAVTVVATGAADFEVLVSHHPYRDIFYDAPLDALSHPSDHAQEFKYNPSNSHFASVNFFKAVGPILHTSVTEEQVRTIKSHIRNARARGLVPRYWGTPRWPRGLRDDIWTLLLREDIGLLNVDDLRAVRKGSWGSLRKRNRWLLSRA